jgi:hypothetical protein
MPILASLSRNAAVDSLLVLLQKRNGIDESLRRCIASGDPRVGFVATWTVPERSMSNALIVGRSAIGSTPRSMMMANEAMMIARGLMYHYKECTVAVVSYYCTLT